MVLEANKQYHSVNKFVIDFLSSLDTVDESVKNALVEEWKRRGASKLKSTMNKTSNAPPKRIVSKYLYFCEDERPKIKAEHPEGINIKDVTCELGKRWREFQANPDPERMNKYTELFEADKKRYDEARAEKQALDDKSKTTTTTKRKPQSAYLNFCFEQRKERPKASMKELSVEWAKVKADPIELAKYMPVKV